MSFVHAFRSGLGVTLLAAGVLLTGCQVKLSRPVAKAEMGNQGSASEVLFLTPEVLGKVEEVPRDQAGRLDATLSPRSAELDSGNRPDLGFSRRVRVVDDGNTFVYFNSRSERHRRPW